ncbi:NitT/TauT family transport system permease protein [Verrucomicrobium sp. GAS474]|uniref:ABC transporter permease n=1 Tax=Verrucomicrobium sp. GAS474 TaxID=1882831 RepID=UPI00087C77E2|nr:ABC transporter permease [Verrucomicrobium sp. GAS474]SDU12395.1 NitT/TauT family transport system permease protein [Verrucomicrobium sp. GAS474]
MSGKTRSLLWRRLGPWLLGGTGILLFLGGWSAVALAFHNAILVPSPWEVAASVGDLVKDGTLLGDLGASLRRVFLGFGIAAGLSVPLALAMGAITPLRWLLLPVVSLLRPIPPIAWIPMAILWFGIGDASGCFITALAAFFPVFINTLGAALSVEPQYLRAARCLGAGRLTLLTRVYLPSSLPAVWTGLKIGLGQSWMAVVTAELVAAQSGLGYMIQLNRIQLETPRVFVGMIVIAITGTAMTVGLERLERVLFPWRHLR